MKLADDVSYHLMESIREREGKKAEKKYGVPYYSNPKGVQLWKAQRSRLRKKAFRRLLPICKRVFQET